MRWICATAMVSALGACQTTEEYAAAEAREEARFAEEIAARQGERVDRICFTRSINGWREFGEDAVLLRKGVDDWYKLDLSGVCDPEWAINAIAVKTRPAGSSCVSRGDEIKTFDQPIDGTCFITAIYEWNEDAEIAEMEED